MKKYLLLLILVAMFYGCNNEELGPQHPLVGEWQLTHSGKIVDGNIEASPYTGIYKLTFFRNGRGWEYNSVDHQLSFKWSLSEVQLITSNWKLETNIIVDYDYLRGDDWAVLQLDTDELTVSYLMSPVFPEDNLEPYTAIMTFEKVK